MKIIKKLIKWFNGEIIKNIYKKIIWLNKEFMKLLNCNLINNYLIWLYKIK